MRAIAAFLVVFLSFGVVTAQTAFAADDPASSNSLNADQMKRLKVLPEAQRTQIRDDLTRELAKKACGNPVFFGTMIGADCEALSAAAYKTFLATPEQAIDFNPDADGSNFCEGLAQAKAPASAIAQCMAESAARGWLPVLGAATRVALQQSPPGQAVLGLVDTVAFVANAKDGFERFANTVKSEGVKSTNEVLNNLTKASSLVIDDDFRNTWASFAAVGIVVLALMYFKLWKDVSKEEIDFEEARKSLFWYGPLSVLLVLFGPAIGYQINAWLGTLTAGFTDWTAGHIATFMAVIARFASYQSNGVFGPLVAVVVFGLLFLGAWGLLALFFLQPFALGMIGLGLALAVGFLIHPEYRERVSKSGALWLGIGLSKPLLVLLMGAVFDFIATRPAFTTDDGVDDPLVNAASVFMAGAAMLLLAFSPSLLFKYVPLLPAASTGLGANRRSVAGAAVVAGAGAGVGEMIRQRRIISNQSASQGGPSTGKGQGGGSTAGHQGNPTGNSRGGQGSLGQGGAQQGGQTIAALQRSSRTGTGGTVSALPGSARPGTGVVARGSRKVAVGGATAFLIAAREAARQAAMRGGQSTQSMAPDTDHISGR